MSNPPDLSRDVYTEQLLNLSGGYIACDAALHITEASAGAATLIGYPDEALEGLSLTEVCLPLAGSDSQLDSVRTRRQPSLVMEQVNVEALHGTRYISLVALPHSDGLLVSLSDVTLQSRQQQALQQQHYELLLLHEKIAAQNQQLTALNNELSELSQRKSDMLAIATHDLRAPLTTTIGYSEMLLEGGMGDITDEQSGAVEAILRQGRHMLGLINTLLDLRRLESGTLHHRTPIALNLLLLQVVRSFHDQAALARVEVGCDMDTEPVVVLGDREMLQQAVVNLVSNGIKYTGAGGSVTLGLQRFSALPLLEPPLDSALQWCAVTIADTGPGIAADDLRRIFEPFFRTRDAHRNRLPGSGLGLSIVQNVTQQHGGRIAVASSVGKGTTFTVYVPCVAG